MHHGVVIVNSSLQFMINLVINIKIVMILLLLKLTQQQTKLKMLKIQSFPTIKLFPKDSDEVIDFFGERTLEGMGKFIDTNGKEGGKMTEETAEHAEDADEELEPSGEELGHEDL